MLTICLKYLFVPFLCIASASSQQQAQFASPCPRLFVYDAKSNEPGKWYGIITLLSETDLTGIWLRLILDRPSVQLGNWFGEVKSTDNKEFLIKNRNFALKAHVPHPVRFYIKYDVAEPVPQLISFRLNAKTLCPESGPEDTPELQTSGSNIPQSTANPVKGPESGGGSNGISGIPGGFHPGSTGGSSETDDGVYPGDFNKPFLEGTGGETDSGSSSSNAECGTVAVQSKSQGQSTVEGEFPWHTALYYTKGIDIFYICSGTLISSEHVISAAHCLTRKQSKSTLNPDNLVVYLGKHYLRRFGNAGIQDRQASLIVIHPNYNPQNLDNDIGIVKLTPSADATDYVRPICLWQESADLNSLANKQGIITGWGFDESGKITEQLIQARMSTVPSETCGASFQNFKSLTSNSAYCARFGNDGSKCVGNSGAGMAFLKSKSSTVWQLRGIVALNPTLQNTQQCDATQNVLFVDVVKYLAWIRQTMLK